MEIKITANERLMVIFISINLFGLLNAVEISIKVSNVKIGIEVAL